MPNPVQIAPDRWLVRTGCHQCFVDVEAGASDPTFRFVVVSLMSGHPDLWTNGLRRRLRQALGVLRGKAGRPFLEMLVLEEVDAVIDALQQARAAAFRSDGVLGAEREQQDHE